MRKATIVGEKTYLRPIEREDIDRGWHDWINDPEVNVHLINPWPQARESMVDYFENSVPPSCAMFAICDKEKDTYIGNARLSSIDWIHRSAVYGRLIGQKEYRGKGYGTDALLLLFRYGFHYLGLNRIWTTVWLKNDLSLASNDKVGMTREGIMKQAVFKNGEFHNTVIIAMLRNDFDKIHGVLASK